MNALVELINGNQNELDWLLRDPENPIMKNIANLDVLGTNNYGNTQLHLVLSYLKVTENVVKEILDLGAPVNAVNSSGKTPLLYALKYNNCELAIVKLLVSRGANVCNCDHAGFGSLFYALSNDNCSTGVIEFLCDSGADVKHIDETGCTMLHYALRNKNLPLEVVQILLDKGISPHSVNNHGDTALNEAVFYNRKDVVDLLLKIPKIKIDLYNNERFTPLHLAVMNSETDPGIIKLLINSGASILKKTHKDQQCLHLAAQRCNPVHIKILLDYGARVNVCDTYKRTPLYIAVDNIWNCNTAALKLLLDAGALIFREKPKDPHDKWVLTNNATNNALHEAIRDFFYNRDNENNRSHVMPIMLLLLKYAILEDPRICFRKLEVDHETKHVVLDFVAKCREELKTVCIAPKVTLAQFILQNSLQAISQSPTDDILEILTAHPYPIYREVVAGLMDKDDLREGLQRYPVYALSRNKLEEREVLDYDTLCGVMTYLADEDLMNLLLAVFEPKRSPVPQVKRCCDCGLYDEIEVESERFRKRARKA